MIVLAGTIRIAPGARARAMPPLLAMVAASRTEPGCLEYSFAFDVNDDHLVRIFECFKDEDARKAHSESAHMKTWRAAWEEAGIGGRDMKRYVVTERAAI